MNISCETLHCSSSLRPREIPKVPPFIFLVEVVVCPTIFLLPCMITDTFGPQSEGSQFDYRRGQLLSSLQTFLRWGHSCPGFRAVRAGVGEGWPDAWMGGSRDRIQVRGMELDAGRQDQNSAHGLAPGRSRRINDKMGAPRLGDPWMYLMQKGLGSEDRTDRARQCWPVVSAVTQAGSGYSGDP